MADSNQFPIATALEHYWEDVGSKRDSASSIHARIKHLMDWMEIEDREEMACGQFDNLSAAAFRTWSREYPVIVNGKERKEPRSPATTEESLNTLRAAFNYAKQKKAIDIVPDFETFGRKAVSNPIVVRVGLATISEMLRYAAEPNKRREALHAFLVASICTLARPGAVLDICVSRQRKQWYRGSSVLRLNPAGRVQTKKHRPDVWVPPPLVKWLEERSLDEKSGGWLVHISGRKVESVDTAWDTMREALGLPGGIEYGSYIIRRSMATILRNWHKQGGTKVDYRELQEQMGHAKQTTTDVYALREMSAQSTVQLALGEALAELERLAPGALLPPAYHSSRKVD
jgi:integrase